MSDTRQRPRRDYGVYIPANEVEIHLHNGWSVLDVPTDCNEVLMKPPPAAVCEAA